MGQIQVTYDGTATDLNDFCKAEGYQDNIINPDPQPEEGEPGYDTWTATIPNPESKQNFFIRKNKERTWNTVYGYRVRVAVDTARDSVSPVEF